MATLAPISTAWIPEDDLLLKNSVEAGASLEALAKGAVPFSRRFTYLELRDRWHSLLYDPDISAQASACMVDLELSGSNSSTKFCRFDNFKGNKPVPGKRKNGSIRRQYYAMRKKFRNEFFNSTSLDFFDDPNLHHPGGGHEGESKALTFDDEPHDGNHMLDECVSEHFGLQETDLEILHNAFHQPAGILAPVMPVNMRPEDVPQSSEAAFNDGDGQTRTTQGYGIVHSGPLSPDGHHVAAFINSNSVSDREFADLSDSLLNFSSEDGVLFMDLDGKDSADKPCYDNVNSLVLSSPNNVREDAHDVEVELTNTCIVIPSAPCLLESETVACPYREDLQIVPHSENNVQSASVQNPDSHQLADGSMSCVLNTEDPDIPCNDDIFLLIHSSTPFGSSLTQPVTNSCIAQTSSAATLKDRELGSSLMKKENKSETSCLWSQKTGQNMLSGGIAGRQLLGRVVKSELPDRSCLTLLPLDAKKAIQDQSHCRLVHAVSKTNVEGILEERVNDVDLKGLENSAPHMENPVLEEADSVKTTGLESMINLPASDNEEAESEDDVPYFSDVEAMILDMDLSPHDQESFSSRQVSRYQSEDVKRRIMRLEQCAHSSLQRAMASRGAFAILYGRHLKYYIKKAEVTLGRSTDDVDVDIDLRQEGRANKISRRQATIKMETCGSFFLRNLGKSSIAVNGKEVATGQLLRLSSSCLIEIRGMSFAFETNDKFMKRFLDGIPQTVTKKE